MVDREFDNRTSLIVDPPDGKLPPLTPAGLRRVAAADAATKRPPAGPEDFTNFIRCITFGTPRVGGNFGAGPYSYYQIFQTAGYVVLFTEMIHEARVISLDRRTDLGFRSAQPLQNSVAAVGEHEHVRKLPRVRPVLEHVDPHRRVAGFAGS